MKNMANDIIVYLEEHCITPTNNTMELWLDFRTERDLEIFVSEYRNQSNRLYDRELSNKIFNYDRLVSASYIHISNFHSSVKLSDEAYYVLNINSLCESRINSEENSAISLLSFDFSGATEDACASLLSLLPHRPQYITLSSKADIHSIAIAGTDKPLKMKVVDAGQANMNILLSDNVPVVIYDVGAPKGASTFDVKNIWQNNLAHYCNPCTLILSHWDIDHYHCLKILNENDILDHFSQIICPNVAKTLTALKTFQKLQNALPLKVYCINPAIRLRNNPYSMRVFWHSNRISLYVGEISYNNKCYINLAGINMYVNGEKASAQFTGDSLFCQADDVLCAECPHAKSNEHYLVVPHHGGGQYKGYNKKYLHYHICHKLKLMSAIISVGINNMHGHPSNTVLKYLRNIFINVHQTSLSGDFEINLD